LQGRLPVRRARQSGAALRPVPVIPLDTRTLERPADGAGVSAARWWGAGKRPKGEREEPPRAGELTSAGERSPAGGCHPADGSLFIATSGGLPAVAIPAQSRLPICRPCAG